MTTGSVAVVGGGLAGLAAAVTLVEAGRAVELFESRRHLGGRAASFDDARLGTLVDHCQHVAMGCCTHLLDFCRRTGLADAWQPQPRLHFVAPDGTRHDFQASRWLPAPLHLLPGLLALRYFPLGERLAIGRTILRLARGSSHDAPDSQETIGRWLQRQGMSQRAIEQFFSVVLTSALGETLDRASLAAARHVFAEGFLTSREAHRLILPQVPLRELFDHRLSRWLATHRVTVHRCARVRRIERNGDRVDTIALADGSQRRFEQVIVAVPWRQVRGLFSPETLSAHLPELAGVDRIEAAPITAVHLGFDRPALPFPHAVLVGRLGHWVFGHPPAGPTPGSSCQAVISASRELLRRDRGELAQTIREELGAVWPEIRQAQLVHWRVVTEPEAVFSVRPGVDAFRPAQRSSLAGLFLAGDWTATGWPATMEGAVRSGQLAAAAALEDSGKETVNQRG